MTTHSRPITRPMPVTRPAAGTALSYRSWAASGESSSHDEPGSSNALMRSRTSSFPRAVCRWRDAASPPWLTTASLRFSPSTWPRICAAAASKSALPGLSLERNCGIPLGLNLFEFDAHVMRLVAQPARTRGLDGFQRGDHFEHDVALIAQFFKQLVERFAGMARGVDRQHDVVGLPIAAIAVICVPVTALREVRKRIKKEAPHVRGILVGVIAGAIRHADGRHRPGLRDPVQFLHEPERVAQMLEHVAAIELINRIIRQRQRHAAAIIEICDDVDAGQPARIEIDPALANIGAAA